MAPLGTESPCCSEGSVLLLCRVICCGTAAAPIAKPMGDRLRHASPGSEGSGRGRHPEDLPDADGMPTDRGDAAACVLPVNVSLHCADVATLGSRVGQEHALA